MSSSAIDELMALPVWPEDLLPRLREAGAATMVVALDDDPTGTQTVRDVPVLTRWTTERLAAVLATDLPLVFLLTNSRSLPSREAVALADAIGRALRESAIGAPPLPWAVVSRSDSTLRGHFPLEVDALVDAMGMSDARVLLAPYFGDGGRLTVGGTHYLRRGDRLVPIGETEFARDPVFGYRSSDLREWVAERSAVAAAAGFAGRTRTVEVVTLDRIRTEGPGCVRDALLALPPSGVLATDAADERDIEVVALGALLAERQGLPLVGRTAASYVRARAGRPTVTPLTRDELPSGLPGIVVAGSHVPTTTAQLERLLADPPVPMTHLELPVAELLSLGQEQRAQRLAAITDQAESVLRDGRTPVVATSRDLIRGADAEADLDISALVSAALVTIVRGVRDTPGLGRRQGRHHEQRRRHDRPPGRRGHDLGAIAAGCAALAVRPRIPLARSAAGRLPGECRRAGGAPRGGPPVVRRAGHESAPRDDPAPGFGGGVCRRGVQRLHARSGGGSGGCCRGGAFTDGAPGPP